jgi:hypothetical protein
MAAMVDRDVGLPRLTLHMIGEEDDVATGVLYRERIYLKLDVAAAPTKACNVAPR